MSMNAGYVKCLPTIAVRFTLLVLLALVFPACENSNAPTAPSGGSPAPAPAPGPTNPTAAEFVTLVNQHRASLGLGILTWHAEAAGVGQTHSQDMVNRGFFSHINPDGETPWDRLAEAGITYTTAGENIAYGYATASAVLAAWLSSPGHKANIENPNFTHHGIGLVGTYWTHVFIKPATSPTAGALSVAPGRRSERAPDLLSGPTASRE